MNQGLWPASSVNSMPRRSNFQFTYDSDHYLLHLIYQNCQEIFTRGNKIKTWEKVLTCFNNKFNANIVQSRTINQRFQTLRKNFENRLRHEGHPAHFNENEACLMKITDFMFQTNCIQEHPFQEYGGWASGGEDEEVTTTAPATAAVTVASSSPVDLSPVDLKLDNVTSQNISPASDPYAASRTQTQTGRDVFSNPIPTVPGVSNSFQNGSLSVDDTRTRTESSVSSLYDDELIASAINPSNFGDSTLSAIHDAPKLDTRNIDTKTRDFGNLLSADEQFASDGSRVPRAKGWDSAPVFGTSTISPQPQPLPQYQHQSEPIIKTSKKRHLREDTREVFSEQIAALERQFSAEFSAVRADLDQFKRESNQRMDKILQLLETIATSRA
ncbi:uncharacterized protein LODBEIA_P32810 [Lodderomyces beijingensis]|uniref:Myb/SANT-like domain-containing protein n=1 Tax=Lodderomyces beijingensis TaxID=1775926 RepID=A0ABP0ZLN7_9ASCO